MSVTSGVGKLRRGAKDLRANWHEVRITWHDDNSRRFEERYIAPVLARLRTMELTMSHMASVLQKARRDCE